MDREDILDSLYADDTPSVLSFPASAPIPNLLNRNMANAGNTFEKTKQRLTGVDQEAQPGVWEHAMAINKGAFYIPLSKAAGPHHLGKRSGQK